MVPGITLWRWILTKGQMSTEPLCFSGKKNWKKKSWKKLRRFEKKIKKFLKKKKMKKENTDFFLNEQNWKIIGKKINN